jgi:hypothetical protein
MTAAAIVSARPISEIWVALGGDVPRHGRARAFYRDGDNPQAVSLNDAKTCWYDYRDNIGGGVLDLIQHVRGWDRANALRWTADLIGCRLDDSPLPASERAGWVRQQQQIALALPKARLWRRAAVVVGEQVLDGLKAALAAPTLPRSDIGEIADWTAQIAVWRRLDGAAVVAEYLWWVQHEPHLANGMIYAATLRGMAERRALCAYLRMTQPEHGI